MAKKRNETPGQAPFKTRLMERVEALSKINPVNYSVEDLRIMIGQQMRLDQAIPMAIEILKANPFAEGDFYPGDLLQNVLRVEPSYWKENPCRKADLDALLRAFTFEDDPLGPPQTVVDAVGRWLGD